MAKLRIGPPNTTTGNGQRGPASAKSIKHRSLLSFTSSTSQLREWGTPDGVYGSRPQDPHTQKNRRYYDHRVTSSAMLSSAMLSSAMLSSARKKATQNMIQKSGESGDLVGHA
ncbi:unnamed protein product, partial [Cuscuta europaea]